MATKTDFDGEPSRTVYYDGACPLCQREIGLYRRATGAEALDFVDVSKDDAPLGADLDREKALARFHVRDASGRLVSGAEGFVALWAALPRWRWLARIASLRGVTPMLERLYRQFLRVRPHVQKRLRRTMSWTG